MERIEILGGILKKIGNTNINKFKNDFTNRLILQKTIYFIQMFKLNLGYNFNFYLYGPYSRDLANDAYKLAEKAGELTEIKFINKKLEERFNNFMIFLNEYKNNPKILELLASIHFLHELHYEKEKIKNIVLFKSTPFSETEFNNGWKVLERQFGW